MNQKFSLDKGFPKFNSPIGCQKLLLVEGKDDAGFFGALLKQLQLEDIEIRSFDGTSNFSTYLKTLKATPGFSQVVSLGIVRDADKDHNSAFQSICSGLQMIQYFLVWKNISLVCKATVKLCPRIFLKLNLGYSSHQGKPQIS